MNPIRLSILMQLTKVKILENEDSVNKKKEFFILETTLNNMGYDMKSFIKDMKIMSKPHYKALKKLRKRTKGGIQ